MTRRYLRPAVRVPPEHEVAAAPTVCQMLEVQPVAGGQPERCELHVEVGARRHVDGRPVMLDDVPAGAAGVVCGQMLGIEPEPSPYAVAAEAARRWAIRHGGAGGYRQGDQTGGREEECGELLQRRLLGGGTGSSFVLVFAAPCLSSHLAPRTQHR